MHPHLKIKANQLSETKLKVKQALLGLNGDESDSHSAADDLPSEDDMLSALNLWIPQSIPQPSTEDTSVDQVGVNDFCIMIWDIVLIVTVVSKTSI